MALPRTRVNVTSDINVTPLVDVMLVLLIIFMVVTPMLQNGVPVSLPGAHNPAQMPDEEKEDAVVVAISHDGKVFLKNKIISPDELTDRVKDLLTNKLDKTVYIRADARARYKTVADSVDAVRAAGVDNVAMMTEKVDKNGHIVAGPGTD
jgi:biopolymer transport protein ExbD/biopolymer transport protein TolR